jgi:hypothetical protein
MSNTSFRRLALSGHQLPPLCGPDNLKRGLVEAKPIRQTRPSLSLKLTICPRNSRSLDLGSLLYLPEPRRSPQLAAPPPARPPPLGVSSPPRSRDRSSGRTGFDRGGASQA